MCRISTAQGPYFLPLDSPSTHLSHSPCAIPFHTKYGQKPLRSLPVRNYAVSMAKSDPGAGDASAHKVKVDATRSPHLDPVPSHFVSSQLLATQKALIPDPANIENVM